MSYSRNSYSGLSFSGVSRWKPVILLAYAAAACVLYIALTPPVLRPETAESLPILGGLPGDLSSYALRFLCSALLFGALPLGIAGALGEKPRTLGITVPHRLFFDRVFLAALAAIFLIGILGAYDPGLYSYYPYSHYIRMRAASGAFGFYLLHALAYALLYYLPWELFFRGVLILPFVGHFEPDPHRWLRRPYLFALASFQIIPSAMLHIGHPLGESMGAVAFGLLAAYFVLKTRSIVLPLVLHIAAGLVLDLAIILRTAEVLP